jgi:hypothetical protein
MTASFKIPSNLSVFDCGLLDRNTDVLEDHAASIFRVQDGAAFSSETSVSVYKSVWCQNPEGHDLIITMEALRYLSMS